MSALKTRKPTGKPPWPMLLIAGAEKAGKSWACAEASSSPLIGRTFWIGCGEDDPDEYAHVPGARFEIVVHDGTYRGLLNAIKLAAAEPTTDDKPNLIVFDSVTRLWDLLCHQAQDNALKRAITKAEKAKVPAPDEADVTMDLWNKAKDYWAGVMDALRAHRGPVVLTARLDDVVVLDNFGKPTRERDLKVKAEKSLPYDVTAIVQMPKRGEAWITGVKSVRVKLPKRKDVSDWFTVDELWRRMGLAEEGATADRQHTGVDATDTDQLAKAVLAEIGAVADTLPGGRQAVAESWAAEHGSNIAEATDVGLLELFRDSLTAEEVAA